MGKLYNADNVVVGLATAYFAPWKPALADRAKLPHDAADLFDDIEWTGMDNPWFKAGATNEGFKANMSTSTTQITIEEQSTPVSETVDAKNLTFEAALAEDTILSVKLAWGGGHITTTAPDVTHVGTKKMFLSGELPIMTFALEMKNVFGFARRIYVPKMSLTGSGDVNFRRAADKRMWPIHLASLCAPEEIEIVDITAPKGTGFTAPIEGEAGFDDESWNPGANIVDSTAGV